MGFLHFLKDVDKYVFGGFFNQGVDGFKQLTHGHVGRAFGDFLGDMAEVVDPVIGTVGNAFTQSMMNGQGFHNALENAGIAAAGGLAGKGGAQAIDNLATRFGVDKTAAAVKNATGKFFKSFADTPAGQSISKGFRNVGNRITNALQEPLEGGLDSQVHNALQEAAANHLDNLQRDEMRQAQRALGTSTARPRGSTFRRQATSRAQPEFIGDLRGTYRESDTSPSFLSLLHRAEGPEFNDGLRYDTGGPTNVKRLRQVGRKAGRLGMKGLRMTGRGVVGVGKGVYRSIPTFDEWLQTVKEYPAREGVETALEDLKEGEQHFPMTYDVGSTGLGGDKPCPDGMVMVNGQCVPTPS